MGAAPARRPPARRAQGGLAPRRIPMPLPPRPPAPRVRPPLPAKRQPTGALVLDKLLHGRGWIGLVCVLLAGIVVFNVNLLQMNRDIAHTSDRAAGVKRENARLRADVARLASSERIQRVAAEAGLVMPAPGEVRYLRSKPRADARRAAERLRQGKLSGPPVAPVAPPGQAEVEAPSTTQPGPAGTGATMPPPTGASAPTAPMQGPAASPQPAP
jgi:cell division protein FtsL